MDYTLKPKEMVKAVKADHKGKLGTTIKEMFGRDAVEGFIDGDLTGGYLSAKYAGSGKATDRLLRIMQDEGIPAVAGKLDDPLVRKTVLNNLQRDIEYATTNNLPIRQDLMNAYEIFANEGFSGLQAARKAGNVALPAIMAPIFLEVLKPPDEEG
jgi:hypothetical protein